jgi:hypothetical protein
MQALERSGSCEDLVIGVSKSLSAEHFVLQVVIPPWHKLNGWMYSSWFFSDIKEILR